MIFVRLAPPPPVVKTYFQKAERWAVVPKQFTLGPKGILEFWSDMSFYATCLFLNDNKLHLRDQEEQNNRNIGRM